MECWYTVTLNYRATSRPVRRRYNRALNQVLSTFRIMATLFGTGISGSSSRLLIP